MSQAVYHNKWQKMYCKGKWESSWWGLLLPLKRFLHISSVWKMELQEDSISSCTQHLYVCLFFFIMNKTSYKKVVVQLFSLQNVSRIFFPDLTTFHRKFEKKDVCEGKIFEQEIKKGIHILSTQCGNSKNVLPLVFSVKSIFANFELLKLPFWQLRGSWFWF